jgi:4-nitrophenyl phosphatase
MRTRALLIDLDGTLYHGDRMIDGADTLILWLREANIPYLFVTNNSTAAPETVAARLNAMGIPADAGDVCTSAQAAADYAAAQHPGARVLVIGEAGLRLAIEGQGLVLTDNHPEVVVQGLDRSFSYERAVLAVEAIRGGAAFIQTNPDLLLPTADGFRPGAGSVGAMLQAASGVEPTVVGKPSSILMNYAMTRLGISPEDAVVVGDNLATDIAAGVTAGCETALVLTGLTNADNYERLRGAAGVEPDRIFPDLSALLSYIRDTFRK